MKCLPSQAIEANGVITVRTGCTDDWVEVGKGTRFTVHLPVNPRVDPVESSLAKPTD